MVRQSSTLSSDKVKSCGGLSARPELALSNERLMSMRMRGGNTKAVPSGTL